VPEKIADEEELPVEPAENGDVNVSFRTNILLTKT
jgi:hypothetical protein